VYHLHVSQVSYCQKKGNGYEVTDGVKILAAALATSVVTVSITEPISRPNLKLG